MKQYDNNNHDGGNITNEILQNLITIVKEIKVSERPAPTTARPQRKRRREEINDVPPCSDSKSPVRIAIVDKT